MLEEVQVFLCGNVLDLESKQRKRSDLDLGLADGWVGGLRFCDDALSYASVSLFRSDPSEDTERLATELGEVNSYLERDLSSFGFLLLF